MHMRAYQRLDQSIPITGKGRFPVMVLVRLSIDWGRGEARARSVCAQCVRAQVLSIEALVP